MEEKNMPFSNHDLWAMVVPLFLEQLLVMLVLIHNVFNAAAMVFDWIIRAVIFIWRQRSGKWKEFQVV